MDDEKLARSLFVLPMLSMLLKEDDMRLCLVVVEVVSKVLDEKLFVKKLF